MTVCDVSDGQIQCIFPHSNCYGRMEISLLSQKQHEVRVILFESALAPGVFTEYVKGGLEPLQC